MEIETDDIDSIQGIPDNANPDKMNNKIDLSNLNNLKAIENLPNADINEISGSNCSINGEYKITATLDKNSNLKTSYNNIELRFSAPESSGVCTMTISGTNIEMTCQNKEKFYESKIYTERQLIQDEDGNGLFFINLSKVITLYNVILVLKLVILPVLIQLMEQEQLLKIITFYSIKKVMMVLVEVL